MFLQPKNKRLNKNLTENFYAMKILEDGLSTVLLRQGFSTVGLRLVQEGLLQCNRSVFAPFA